MSRSVGVNRCNVCIAFIVGFNRTPNVVNHALKDTHDVLVVRPRTFDIKGNEFIQMSICVVFFSTESWTNFEHSLKTSRHAQLLEQLWRLVEEGRRVEVHHWEQICSSFGGSGDNFWRVGFKKAL